VAEPRGGIPGRAGKKPSGNSPFIVGVSGHRDLDPDDVPRLREAVGDFVHQLKRHLPDTELRIIVGMAAGADLLVAQAALDLGVAVEAVLPMELDQYAADFHPESLALLRQLLARPDVHCVELTPPAHILDERGAVIPENRDAMYANLTAVLIRRSGLLLALWDGNLSRLPGGTADTVLRYLGVRTDETPGDGPVKFAAASQDMDAAERLVYWAPSTRSSGGVAASATGPCFLRGIGDNELEMQRAMPAQLSHQLALLNHYNREYQELLLAGRLGQPDSLLAALPADAPLQQSMMLEDVDAQYGKADALAVYYQLRSDRLFYLFGLMAFTMGLAYLAYEKLTESRLLLLAYVFILLTSLGLYYLLGRRRWFAKHLTYRALAETMRAKFYLRLAGVDHRVDTLAVLAMSGIDRFQGFDWITYVLNGVEAMDIHAAERNSAQIAQSRCVEQSWIESQHRYFAARVERLERSSRRVRMLRNTVFVVILVVIVALFLFGKPMHHYQVSEGVTLSNVLTFCMGFLAVLLGVWELHQDKMATRELLWQYRNQLNHFSRARAQLSRITQPSRRNDVLVELGRDSLMESYLWTIHRYHREHEPPAAG
jgi:hypothetical protein